MSGSYSSADSLDRELEDGLAGGNLGHNLLEGLTESLTSGGVLGDAASVSTKQEGTALHGEII